jgi:hypothetical protein
MSTLIGSTYRIITKLFFASDEVVQSSLLYFYSGAVTVLGCVGAYWYLQGMDITAKVLAHTHARTHTHTYTYIITHTHTHYYPLAHTHYYPLTQTYTFTQ